MTFSDSQTLTLHEAHQAALTGSVPKAAWTKATNQSLPHVGALLYPGQAPLCATTNQDTRQYLSVWRASDDIELRVRVLGWKAFVGRWKELFASGLRLVAIETFPVGNERQCVGVFREGSGRHAVISAYGWDAFTKQWDQESRTGLRLVAVDSFALGTARHYLGVMNAGHGGHALHSVTQFGIHRVRVEDDHARRRRVLGDVAGRRSRFRRGMRSGLRIPRRKRRPLPDRSR